jgi:hypothetical protein
MEHAPRLLETEVYDLYMKIDQPDRRLMVKHKAPLPDGYRASEWRFHSTQSARSRRTLEVECQQYCDYVLPPPVKMRLRSGPTDDTRPRK